MKKFGAIILFLFISLVLVGVTQAATIDTGETVTVIDAGPGDVYAAGGMVSVPEQVTGDLLVAGGKVNINGVVSDDVLAVGGDVIIDGTVGGDVRVAGGTVVINGQIHEDLLVFGGNVTIGNKAKIDGNVMAFGGLVSINGAVGGNVTGSGGKIYLNSKIDGSVEVTSKGPIVVTPNSVIAGNFTYASMTPASLPAGVVKGKVEQTKPAWTKYDMPKYAFGAHLAGKIFFYLTLLILGSFFILPFPYFFKRTSDYLSNSFLKTFGLGLLFMLLFMPAIIIFAVTGIGLPISFMLMASVPFLLFFAWIIVGIWVGSMLMPLDKKASLKQLIGRYAAGLFVTGIITAIPIIGWVIWLIATLAGIGSLIRCKWDITQYLRQKKQI